MPIYEYECDRCGRHFTEAMTIDDHDRRRLRCPECKGETHDIIAAVNINAPRKS